MSPSENYALEELFNIKNFSKGFLRKAEECIEATDNRMMKYENEVWSVLKPDYTFENVETLEKAILAFKKSGKPRKLWYGLAK